MPHPNRPFYVFIPLDKIWTYIHVWKNGGLSISEATGIHDVNEEDGNYAHLFTFVRDPIDHFISGFKEEGKRIIEKGGRGYRRGN